MKKYQRMIRFIYILEFIFSIWLYIKAPATIAVHFSGSGKPDAFDSKYWLFLLPVLLILAGEILIFIAKKKRKKIGLEQIPTFLPNEWTYITVMFIFFIIFSYFIQQEILY
ncbi:DUF1648 domain-containing protein [Melissococcus plutonius]|uniref:Integral membrane protein n=1 Tax=Melissococcus plutonius TaxID=33970 RepID=A0A2Z5Y0E7_9ENTE|nr:DUF1648 domain-containing protein [Melissococcus plutonius]BAL61367.1 integral membrane protein [Melissococcus plutonius DAT561]MCV2498769.1 DUF1648 domain-containing protein [Melissococcus plutonius]MCV2501345.1 DUF1648 domain-containing protein [Melissococcus plutonius]MCV2504951.1 DUF1648 domain-containing protein [Melissococcus plutonius]MCV2507385.1 DUF1648 domain-containing protein [Melissococcus plutonius]